MSAGTLGIGLIGARLSADALSLRRRRRGGGARHARRVGCRSKDDLSSYHASPRMLPGGETPPGASRHPPRASRGGGRFRAHRLARPAPLPQRLPVLTKLYNGEKPAKRGPRRLSSFILRHFSLDEPVRSTRSKSQFVVDCPNLRVTHLAACGKFPRSRRFGIPGAKLSFSF
jgi:hypothetical protein